VATAEGEPSLTFWQTLFKPQAVYGGDVITGWVGDLFPYVKDPVTAAPTVRNPLLAPPRVDLQVKDGIQIKDLPNGLSCTRIRQQLPDGTIQSSEIVAGLIGLSQQPVTGSVCAELGWWVASEPLMAQLITSLPDSPQPPDTKSRLNIFMGTMTRELVEWIARRGGTTLFGETSHPWKLYTFGECGECTQHQTYSPGLCFGELADGRVLIEWSLTAYKNDFSRHRCVAIGRLVPGDGWAPAVSGDAVVIAKDLPEFLQRLVDAHGVYYFDLPDFGPNVLVSDFIAKCMSPGST